MNKPVVAFDLETFLIDGPIPPKPVCITWWGHPNKDHRFGIATYTTSVGKDGVFHNARSLLKGCSDGKWNLVGQNVKFDLGVLWYHYPDLRHLITNCVLLDRIHDTMLREKLYTLSTEGTVHGKKGKYSLAGLAKKYLGRDLSLFKSGPDVWRLRYGELHNVPLEKWPQAAIDYPILDVEITHNVYLEQEKLRKPDGVGSMNTEHLQVAADFILDLISKERFKLDIDAVEELRSKIETDLLPIREKLIELGYASITKKGSYRKNDKKFREYLCNNYSAMLFNSDSKDLWTVPSLKQGRSQIRIDEEALSKYPHDDELIKLRKESSILEKYLSTYVAKFEKAGDYQHFEYDALKETGRTSGFMQLIPKEGGIRECFYDPNYYIVAIDYSALELCTVAQAMYETFGWSKVREFLNDGDNPVDIHSVVGCHLEAYDKGIEPDFKSFIKRRAEGCPEAKNYRNRGKPVGLGFFGGLGCETMCKVARSQGVDMTLDQAEAAKAVHSDLFPEIVHYLRSYERSFINQLKEDPLNYGYSVNGRYRSKCTYASCANGYSMQSRAADGAKEVMKLLLRELLLQEKGIKPWAFIHDEFLFKVSKDKSIDEVKCLSQLASDLMVTGMQKLCPDVRITVEASIMERWTKDESQHLWSCKYFKNPYEEKLYVA